MLAVFAVQYNLNNDGDVVVIDESKKQLIQDTFWAMHEISAEVEEITATPEPTEDEPDPEPVTEYILHITVSSKSVDALADLYRFTQDQREILHQLLSEEMRPSLLALCGGIAVADGELCWPLPGHTYISCHFGGNGRLRQCRASRHGHSRTGGYAYPRRPQRCGAGQRLERQLRQSGAAG